MKIILSFILLFCVACQRIGFIDIPAAAAPTSPAPIIAPSSLTVTTPSPGTSVSSSGMVTITGIAGSDWINVAAYDANHGYLKISGDVTPLNGIYSIQIDMSLVTSTPTNISVIAFSVPAQQGGGTSTSVNLVLNVPTLVSPTPTPTPVPTPTQSQIKIPFNGLCVEAHGVDSIQNNCDSTNLNQRFTIVTTTTNHFMIQINSSNKCMTYSSGHIIPATCDSASPQQDWFLIADSNGGSIIQENTDARCFNVSGNSTSVNGSVIGWYCGSSPNGDFNIVNIP